MKVTKFLKQNFMFVLLLSIIVCVTLGLGIYHLLTSSPKETQSDPTPTPPKESETATEISYLSADFKSGNTVRVSWTITQGEAKVSALELYCNENKLADVTSLNYFEMPLGVYQFYGNVPFTLQATLDNGEVLSKNVQVQIPKILSPRQEITHIDDGVEVTFHYKYYENDTIEVPKLYLMNSGSAAWQVEFVSNVQEGKEGIYVNAAATYRIRAEGLASGSYGFDVRYVFEQVAQSFNDRVEFVYERVESSEGDDHQDPDQEENDTPNEEASTKD